MAHTLRSVSTALAVNIVSLSGALAQPAADVMAFVRADRWIEADNAASRYADPVVGKLVTYYRLMAPATGSFGAGGAEEIAAFMATSPDWPLQGTLARRRDEALAQEPDDGTAASQCDRMAPQSAGALLRCAEAYARVGRPGDSAAASKRAWVASNADAAVETRLLQRFGANITGAEQWQRFERLAWTDTAAATRQMARLTPADHARAEVWLALRRDDATAPALLAALPASQRGEPGLVFEQARFLRRANQDEAAVAVWTANGRQAEATAPAERRAAFWDERNLLARRRLRQGDPAGAYALAAGHAQTGGEQRADAEFLAGFIALEKLRDPARAAGHFTALAGSSKAAITQGRAHYWLARAAVARGDNAGAKAEFTASAAYPNTFYGQLSAIALNPEPSALAARIAAAGDPPADATRALDLAGRELSRAAAYLVGWGELRRAQAFLLRLDDISPDPADRALAARLAAGLGTPETAIAIARRAGRDGVVLLDSGWPVAAELPQPVPVEPALALGIIRQESSFDGGTISPVGARGLMQLMPATASQVARKLGLTVSVPALVLDPGYNMRLGTAYLRELLDQFGGTVPFAVAGYNAGPGRVREWVSANGDPLGGGIDMIDWIELIPFGETRNYVQRVIENQVIYRAKIRLAAAHPLAAWLR